MWGRADYIKYIPLCSVRQTCQGNCGTAAECSKWHCWVFTHWLAVVYARLRPSWEAWMAAPILHFELLNVDSTWFFGCTFPSIAPLKRNSKCNALVCRFYLFCHYFVLSIIFVCSSSDLSAAVSFLFLVFRVYTSAVCLVLRTHVSPTACHIIGSSGTVIEAVCLYVVCGQWKLNCPLGMNVVILDELSGG